MATIKISEMDYIPYMEIEDSAYTVVENEKDTYRTNISDLKNLFSCDNKIQALEDKLTDKIDILATNTIDSIDTIFSKLDSLDNKLDVMQSSLDSFGTRVRNVEQRASDLEQRATTNENNIQSIKTNLTTLNTFKTKTESRLNTLESDNTANKNRLTAIESMNDEQNQRIEEAESNITDIKKDAEDFKEEINTTLTNEVKIVDDRLTRIRLEIMRVIDGIHHTTHEQDEEPKPPAAD